MRFEPEADAHAARMRLILRWRRIVSLACVFLAAYALFIMFHNPVFRQTHLLLVQSLCAFIVAALIAVNLLTFRLARSKRR